MELLYKYLVLDLTEMGNINSPGLELERGMGWGVG